MSDELKCNCQHCGGLIGFWAEMAGQTINCPLCQLGTLLAIPPAVTSPASDPQPQVENSGQSELFGAYLKKEKHSYTGWAKGEKNNYVLYLAPGDVRYLHVRHFLEHEADEWIAYFKQRSLTPEIQGPYHYTREGRAVPKQEAVIPEAFVQEPTWEDKFRILHSFAVLRRDYESLLWFMSASIDY